MPKLHAQKYSCDKNRRAAAGLRRYVGGVRFAGDASDAARRRQFRCDLIWCECTNFDSIVFSAMNRNGEAADSH